MAFIRCASGGGSNTEVIEGTQAGAINTEWTVTSQQGKAPKFAMVWMSAPNGNVTSACYWNGKYASGKSFGQYNANGTWGVNQGNVGAANNYNPYVKSVGADSITFKFCATATYVNGTFTYHVEFE